LDQQLVMSNKYTAM